MQISALNGLNFKSLYRINELPKGMTWSNDGDVPFPVSISQNCSCDTFKKCESHKECVDIAYDEGHPYERHTKCSCKDHKEIATRREMRYEDGFPIGYVEVNDADDDINESESDDGLNNDQRFQYRLETW